MYDNIQWLKRYGQNGHGELILDDTYKSEVKLMAVKLAVGSHCCLLAVTAHC